MQVDEYLQEKGNQLEREMAAEIILHILDKIMQNTRAINSQQVSVQKDIIIMSGTVSMSLMFTDTFHRLHQLIS